jgi:hypothetical protein
VDGTFKLCRHPFSQLLTVNAFVRADDHAKQVPLAFVLMSGRKKKDYKAIFQAILEVLPISPLVKRITLDFEVYSFSICYFGQGSRFWLVSPLKIFQIQYSLLFNIRFTMDNKWILDHG